MPHAWGTSSLEKRGGVGGDGERVKRGGGREGEEGKKKREGKERKKKGEEMEGEKREMRGGDGESYPSGSIRHSQLLNPSITSLSQEM